MPCFFIFYFFPFPPAEIRNGNLKSILGLFFILSRYKQQQQQQQQYYQSLVELSQHSSSSGGGGTPLAGSLKAQDMQSRYRSLSLIDYRGSVGFRPEVHPDSKGSPDVTYCIIFLLFGDHKHWICNHFSKL